ncbi:MAG: hypothetical protein OEV74_08100 [Cyclobacteriaceae bacterium]|nr:hypothetical protein [Cyclobacteriaceae bacterium]MDH5251582.1 hypothetical protein [Cyclobacteriaceae bacterium]
MGLIQWWPPSPECCGIVKTYQPQYPTLRGKKVGSREVLQLVNDVIHLATEIKKALAIAVCGPEGELISSIGWMTPVLPHPIWQGTSPMPPHAIQKIPGFMGELMRENDHPPAFWGDDQRIV